MPSPERSRRELRNRARLALWLALPFIALMLLVSPRGDFPLNDDWVYAKMVQALAERGHFGLSPFSNAYALTQTLYAATLVKLFGFSFTLLRLTTIFMGWVTVCFTAFTARELGLPNRSAILAALTVFVNPLFINLSYTFMTDVPFCGFASISMYYFVKSFRTSAATSLLIGTTFALAAFFDRQLGMLIPIMFCLVGAFVFKSTPNGKSTFTVVSVLVPCLLALAVVPLLGYPTSNTLTVTFERQTSLADVIPQSFLLFVTLTTYLGIFLCPFALATATRIGLDTTARMRPGKRKIILLFSAIAIPGPLALFFFPALPNIIRDFGIGPVLFTFIAPKWWDMGIHFAPVQIGMTWAAVAYTATLAISIQFDAITRQFRKYKLSHLRLRRMQILFLLGCALAFLAAPLTIDPAKYFDRYLLPSVPPLAIVVVFCLGYSPGNLQVRAAVLACAALFAWSLIGSQDYMAWNTARWKAVEILRTKYSAQNNEINAGFEFNGMYTSEEYLRRTRDEPDTFKRKKWWVIGEKYRVSPVDLTEHHNFYEILEKVPYYSWIGFETRYMYAMRLNPQP